jgi:dTDP-4-amino-4,6-dideoxygalactose transaminase
VETLRSDFLTTGPKPAEFEEALKAATGAKYAVALCNGTAALHAACFAAGLGPGDEAITTPMTFAASANCVLYQGARPVFCDIDPATWNIDPNIIESCVTDRTKAIIPVHYAGLPCDMDAIMEIADRRGLAVIEDAAHAIGATYGGRPIGSIGRMTCFSFHPVKQITSGEGGAVTTDDEALYRKLVQFRSHGITRDAADMAFAPPALSLAQPPVHGGRSASAPEPEQSAPQGARPAQGMSATGRQPAQDSLSVPNCSAQEQGEPERRSPAVCPPWYYEQQFLGYNYRLSDIHAALGVSQLKKLGAFLARRRQIAEAYRAAFSGLCESGAMALQRSPENAGHAWHLFAARLDAGRRDAVFDALLARGVGANLHYIPVYLHPHYRRLGYPQGLCPAAERLYAGLVTLPLFPAMSDGDADYVIKCVLECVEAV